MRYFCQTASDPVPADTIADGNWSSTSTWRGGVVPGANTPVTIAHAVTLDQPVTTGSPGNAAGVVVVAGSLTVLAPLIVTNGISVRRLDGRSRSMPRRARRAPSSWGTPYLPRYVSGDLAPGPMFGVALEAAALTLTGTTESRPYLRTQAGNTAKACVSGPYSGATNSGTTVTMSHADLTDLGDATHSAFGPRDLGSGSWSLVKWDAFHATDCVFTRCALYLDISHNTDATSGLSHTRFADSVSIPYSTLNAIYLIMPVTGKSLFTIDTCSFDIDVIFQAVGSPTTVADTVFGGVVYHIGGLLLTGAFERNFLLQGDDTDGKSYISIPMASSLMKDCYLFSLFTGPNPHLMYVAGDAVIDGCIVDMPLTYSVIKGMSDSGDTFLADATLTSLTVKNTLFLPLPLDRPRAPGAMPDEHLNLLYVAPTICEHCTSYANYALENVSGTRLVEGGEYTTMTPGWLVSVKSNLVYHTLGNMAVVNWAVATNVQDGANASAADIDFNGGYFANPPAGSANGYATTHLTGPVGAHDVHGDPGFVDPTRGFVTWSRTQRGHNSTNTSPESDFLATYPDNLPAAIVAQQMKDDVLAGIADLVADPTLLSGMMAWVKAGFAPTNPAFAAAAHDGTTIGAMPYTAPPDVTSNDLTFAGPFGGESLASYFVGVF